MYYEEVGRATADHLGTHIAALLADIQADAGDGIKLVFPQAIETDNLVGGVYTVDLDRLPAYAVDVLSKELAGPGDDGFLYTYTGHIAAVVSAGSEVAANKICKRHGAAIEQFIRTHQFMHEQVVKTGECTIHEFGFAGSSLSGAARTDEADREVWVAGIRLDVAWITRESGIGQHA